MKKIYILIFIFFIGLSQAQINRYVRKASRAIGKSNFERAREYFLKAYNVDKNSYKANLGLGVVLGEFMARYEEALPYLENAYNQKSTDPSVDAVYALAKSYHHMGEYEKAIEFYNKLDGSVALEDDDKQYQLDLKKRKDDCLYGLANKNTSNQKDWYIVNAGSNINTTAPEYVPVITSKNELIFTSRRKDSPKEKVQKEDGKYYESMYISKIENGKPKSVRRYTVPDLYLKSKYRKHHESIISVSPDGKTLFVFRDAKIYEINMDSTSKTEPTKLAKTINFDYYQNHAYLTKDRKTLLFTSEAKEGMGGLDIYRSDKDANGQWGNPVSLGTSINTIYDEDSPYLSDDGKTLYFASKGHPGYGSFDIYKSNLVNDSWSEPENLGQPINSPGHDIFFINHTEGNAAYFASSRKGGYGDMDIYKINYLRDVKKECTETNNNLLTLNTTTLDEKSGSVKITSTLADYFKPLQQEWKLNASALNDNTSEITTTVPADGNENTILSKVIAYCDTCFEPVAICNTTKITLGKKDVLVSTEDYTVKNPYDPDLTYSYLPKNKLSELGFNLIPVHFNLNKSDIRDDSKETLNKDVETLLQHKELSVLIYGFADSRAAEKYNLSLSKKRANQVKQYLITKGISPKQITLVSGKGEQFILNKCTEGVECDDASHEQNRRVEFIIAENK